MDAQFMLSSDDEQQETAYLGLAESNCLPIPEKFVAHPQLKPKNDHCDVVEAADVPVLDVPVSLSEITPRVLPDAQFTAPPFSLPERRTKLWWIAAAAPAAGLWLLGSATGHPLAAIGVLAGAAGACALVAWGNWVLDNTVM